MVIVQMTNRKQTICSGGSIASAAPISPQIPIHANCGLQLLSKWYLQAADEAPAVGGPVLAMLWGVQSPQQVIVTVILGSCHPIISWTEDLRTEQFLVTLFSDVILEIPQSKKNPVSWSRKAVWYSQVQIPQEFSRRN